MSSNGEPRVTAHTIALPLYLLCRPRAALKTATHKFTLDTEASAQPLTDIFDDFLYAYQDVGLDVAEILGGTAGQAMGFQFWSNSYVEPAAGSISRTEEGLSGVGATASAAALTAYQQPAVVSILVSKTAGRYRVQSDSFPALLAVVHELDRRLRDRISQLHAAMGTADAPHGEGGGGTIGIVTCADALPLDDYFATISAHFAQRLRLQEFVSQLNDCAHQFRMIQKRLLVRFKDRNPTPLGGLDILLKESYRKLLQLGPHILSCLRLKFPHTNKPILICVDFLTQLQPPH